MIKIETEIVAINNFILVSFQMCVIPDNLIMWLMILI